MTTPATASNLRDLHQIHQRAKAIRDRLISGPKTLAARQIALTNRQTALDASKKALQDAKVQLKKKEHTVQSVQAKIDDLKVKLNAVKKNEEYKAIQNQIALDKNTIEKLDDRTRNVASEEAEVKAFAGEVAAMKDLVETQAASQREQLAELEAALLEAESVIPEDVRERYLRTVKQHGADAMAAVDYDRKSQLGSCSGCFVSVTTQALNELINGAHLSFCKTCGRILYLPEEDHASTRRGG
ncbi:MAG: C4-type zinc ribbon domain-containing protein [Planctomycetia bacterium]|nr:C4-type zinc ribbon domain-containing protein [Planctomycetia bacterium]